MSEKSTKNSERLPPWEPESEGGSVGFGLWLRRQREMRDVPLREIADVTKISLRYLEALEQDRFDVLPAPVFARGFLREYSRYVGLDADEVVNSFLIATGEIDEQSESDEDEPVESRSARNRTLLFVVLTVLAIAAIVVAVSLISLARDENPVRRNPIAAPVPPPVVKQAEQAEPAEEAAADAVAAPLIVTIDFTEDCWMEAVVDDDRTISELRVQGESMRLEAEERVVLTLGNPSGVRVEVNGAPYDFSYSQSRIVRNLEIDLALASALGEGES